MVTWRNLFFLILCGLPLVLVAGCMATSKSILKEAKTLTVCLNSECTPVDGRYTRDQLIGGLLVMLKANENAEAVLCAADSGSQKCKRESLRWFVQGGPIPGVASYKKPYITQVALDKETSQIKYLVDATVRWIGTPVFCADAFTTLTVTSDKQVSIESSLACTWLAAAHLWSFRYSVAFIDFDKSIIAGNYAVAGAGIFTIGGGSGSFAMRFPQKNTLLALAREGEVGKAILPDVIRLPAKLLATAASKAEDFAEAKKKSNAEERGLWERVAKDDTPESYREYLDRYPDGRFAEAAGSQLQLIEERAAQNREVEFWSTIKDSKNPKDFERYLDQYPQGFFVDLASARAKRLMASASEAADLDVEIAFWNQVKGSTDPNEVRDYLNHYPEGQFAALARSRLEKFKVASMDRDNLELRMWNQIKDSRNISDYQNFLQVFPQGIFADISKSRLDVFIQLQAEIKELTFWNRVRESSNPEDFFEYLRHYPTGQYAKHARRLAKNLESLRVEQEELELWEYIKGSKNPDDFDRYLSKYQDGRFATVARNRQKEANRNREITAINFGCYHALVIGNNSYWHFRKLNTAVNDARKVASLLQQGYGFEVTCLIDAGRKEIIDALYSYRRRLTTGDNLIIYYAGHGWMDKETGRGYWLPIDSDRDSSANWISTNDISDVLKAIAAKHVMVVADSCYAGTLARAVVPIVRSTEYLRRIAGKRSRIALTSGGIEPVLDSGGSGHSVFAKAFLEVLQRNEGVLEGTRLFEELRRPVVLNSPQTPEYSDILYAGHEGGDFLFVRKLR